MTFTYTPSLIESGLSYPAYRQHINNTLAQAPVDDNAAKLRPRMQENTTFMDGYDQSCVVSADLRQTIEEGPDSIWLVIAEGWCTDAAFSLPLIAALERTFPKKIELRIFLRDDNLELIDANLTDGGRSIPKLIILDKDLQELATWGPRPARLISQVADWKAEGLSIKQIIPKLHTWYDADANRSIQEELELLLAALPVESM